MSIAQGRGRTGRSPRSRRQRPGFISRTVGAGVRGIARGRSGRLRVGFRRGRGISKTELRGFRKVVKLLKSVGMRPKGTGARAPRRTA